jgi:23S rRNA (cytosine1962-C5)-methyltransferase
VSPLLIFEDDHLLVVNKPAGLNTHAPSPFAGEGLYDWLRHREPRWATLAIIHRLDKETSGVMVFSKTPPANRSLTQQFTKRTVHKRYLLLTDRPVPDKEITVRSALVRAGERYLSRPVHAGAEVAETRFRKREAGGGGLPEIPLAPSFAKATEDRPDLSRGEKEEPSEVGEMRRSALRPPPGSTARSREVREAKGMPLAKTSLDSFLKDKLLLVEAEPLTGRTHQIRVQAAEQGFPVLGDMLYGGTPAPRVYLHAAELRFNHPAKHAEVRFQAPADFGTDPREELRRSLMDSSQTNAFRLIHGASDGWPGWYVDKLGDYLLSQGEQPLAAEQAVKLIELMQRFAVRGAYHKLLSRQARNRAAVEASPHLVLGTAAPAGFEVLENGLKFELSFNEGYSVGLFLDQRENRRRLLTGHVAAGFSMFQPGTRPKALEVLNAFAYTCGFSVCAAKAGARVTSLDLSRKYLDWGKRNFALNQLEPDDHDFIYGDVFDWLRRLAKKGRRFDLILLDPPTFSQSKASGTFSAQKDYGKLIVAVLPLLASPGVLFASTNAADWLPPEFVETLKHALEKSGRRVAGLHYAPQPPDFPISRAEPGYLKTAWMRVEQI